MQRVTGCPACRALRLPVASTSRSLPSFSSPQAGRLLHSSSTLFRGSTTRSSSKAANVADLLVRDNFSRSSRNQPQQQRSKPGQLGGRGRRPSHGSKRPSPQSVLLSTEGVREKLADSLKRRWINQDDTVRRFGKDLGLEPAKFQSLTAEFARLAAKELDGKRPSQSMKVAWDFDALAVDVQRIGLEGIQQHIQREFLVWAAKAHPPPPPTSGSVVPEPTLSRLHHLSTLTDFRFLGEAYPEARSMKRKFILHVGPTNSGKTHRALVALSRARTGCYAGPLRLLAHEIFSRFNEGKIGDEGKRLCNLLTGEEQRILDPNATLSSCTVEMFPIGRRLDVGVVDEIQMLGDLQRGSAWTNVLLGAQCKELHLCGEESIVELVQHIAAELGDECVVNRYDRLSPLAVASESLRGDLKKIRQGDCFVTFSRTNIFAFKRMIEEQTGLRVAVAYGGLPPEVREEQARAFNEGAYDVLVASDAVGMGLNLKIKRIVFETVHKWDGQAEVPLSMPQIKQIAGRAGRYVHKSPTSVDIEGASEAIVTAGEATTLQQADMQLLRQAMKAPIVPVSQAILTPAIDATRAVQAVMPTTTRLSRVLSLVSSLSRTAPVYAMGSPGSFPILDAIEGVQPLTFIERLMFGQAPVNTRDPLVVAATVSFAKACAAGGRVLPKEWAEESGLAEALDRIREAQAGTLGKVPGLGAAKARKALVSIFTPANLAKLESYHRCLTLYLWLSYRNADVFCEMEEARLLRKEVEAAIQFCLAGTNFKPQERKRRAPMSDSILSGSEVGAIIPPL